MEMLKFFFFKYTLIATCIAKIWISIDDSWPSLFLFSSSRVFHAFTFFDSNICINELASARSSLTLITSYTQTCIQAHYVQCLNSFGECSSIFSVPFNSIRCCCFCCCCCWMHTRVRIIHFSTTIVQCLRSNTFTHFILCLPLTFIQSDITKFVETCSVFYWAEDHDRRQSTKWKKKKYSHSTCTANTSLWLHRDFIKRNFVHIFISEMIFRIERSFRMELTWTVTANTWHFFSLSLSPLCGVC